MGETAPEHKFNAGKWVVSELRAARAAESEKNSGAAEGKLRLLDVGAIKNQYLDHGAWLDVTAIDLNPQHPSVIKADFFEFSRECVVAATMRHTLRIPTHMWWVVGGWCGRLGAGSRSTWRCE